MDKIVKLILVLLCHKGEKGEKYTLDCGGQLCGTYNKTSSFSSQIWAQGPGSVSGYGLGSLVWGFKSLLIGYRSSSSDSGSEV